MPMMMAGAKTTAPLVIDATVNQNYPQTTTPQLSTIVAFDVPLVRGARIVGLIGIGIGPLRRFFTTAVTAATTSRDASAPLPPPSRVPSIPQWPP